MTKFESRKQHFYEKDGVKVALVNKPSAVAAAKRKKLVKRTIGWSVFAAIAVVFAINILILPFTTEFSRVDRVLSYDGDNKYICFDEKTKISAHRAGGDLAPEETLMAFELCMTATDYVVDIVEFDLHLTKDNKLVLLHDDTVDRTSNAAEHFGRNEISVSDLTYAQLKELNFGENFKDLNGNYPYRNLRGEAIPENVKILLLDDLLIYLEDIRSGELEYIIEIKDGGSRGERAMDKLYNTLVEFGITDRTIVGTFQNNVTKYIDDTYPQVKRSASILEVLDFFYAFLYNVNLDKKNLKYDVLQIPYDQFVLNFGTKAVIDYAHTYDIAVQYWTINDPVKIKELVENGADAIMTDNPERAYSVING